MAPSVLLFLSLQLDAGALAFILVVLMVAYMVAAILWVKWGERR